MGLANDNLAWIAAVVILVVVVAVTSGRSFLRSRREAQLLQTGMDAEAKILEIIDTGNISNNKPVCRIILEVRPAGEAPFSAEVQKVLSAVHLSKYPEGSMVPVKYDPQDRSRVLVILR